MDQPTTDEILRVRRHECAVNGHTWTAINRFGEEDPVRFVCDNCGRSIEVAR